MAASTFRTGQRGRIAMWILLATCSGCATIPPESVTLSATIGTDIEKGRVAHLSMLDAYFRQRAESNDAWVLNTYLPALIAKSKSNLADGCKKRSDTTNECASLTEGDIRTLIDATVTYRDELQRTLEASRVEAAGLINEHYQSLQAANGTITGLLASAVDADSATDESLALLAKETGLEIDTKKIDQTVSDFLAKAGDKGAKVSELAEALDKLIGSGTTEGTSGEKP